MNLYEVTKRIIDIYKPLVNTYSFGTEDELDMDRTEIYPLVHLVPTPSLLNNPILSLGYTVYVLDRIDWTDIDKREEFTPENRQDNLIDVMSSCLQIQSEAFSQLQRGIEKPWTMSDIGNLTPEIREGKNVLAGYRLDFTVSIPNAGVTDGIC